MNNSEKQLIELYIATFGRAPDVSGLTFWLEHLTAGTLTLQNIAKQFFDATETKLRYPDSLSYGDFVDGVYNNVLNRGAEAAGKAYWVDRLERGTITKEDFILTFIAAASSNEGTSDQQLVNNKTAIGYYYAITLALSDTTLAFHVMESITSDTNTVTRVKADLSKFTSSYIYNKLDSLDNTFTATEKDDWMYGMQGNDTLDGGDGKNYIYGGIGNDTLYGGKVVDTLHGDAGNDILHGGAGDDVLYGGEGSDTLYGGEGKNILYGDAGDDYIYGGIGIDTIYGGTGNDIIIADLEADRIYGEDGDDYIEAGDGANWVDGGTGNDTIYGGSGIDTLYGGEGNDILQGFAGVDTLSGMLGNDTIYGGEGNDTLYGDEDNDFIYGELGDDALHGGLGLDSLTGGAGQDTFIFKSTESTLATMDVITDFNFSTLLGDYIALQDHGTEVITTTKVNVSAATTLSSALDLASTGDGSVNALVKWFIFQNNTYLVEDMNVSATYNATTDIVIKLQGVYDFSTLDTSTLLFS